LLFFILFFDFLGDSPHPPGIKFSIKFWAAGD
jgi:hypothetical protein